MSQFTWCWFGGRDIFKKTVSVLKVTVVRWYQSSVAMVLVHIFMDRQTSFMSVCIQYGYCIVYYYNGAERFEQFLQDGRLYRALILLGLALYYPSVSVFWPSWWGIYIVIFKKNLVTSFSLPFSALALTWLTNRCPSMLWNCWLGHTTRKIASEMTYGSSGTLNPTIPYSVFIVSHLCCHIIKSDIIVIFTMSASAIYVADTLLKVTVVRWYQSSVAMVLVHIFMDRQTSFMSVCIQISAVYLSS